ncbi:hypothetical protein LTR85_006931 [Meristemomyces frigidus]|nr:hypothetical protein LTR85_006931 [Meristemomyces frigidus]
MVEPLPSLLRLTCELRIQILGYILQQGETIIVSEGGISKRRRKLNREVGLLKDPNWKAPRRHNTEVLHVCKDLRLCGAPVFWSGNTFAFGDCETLRRFIDLASEEALSKIKSIVVGEDYHYDDGRARHMPAGERAYRHVVASNWPHPDWPPSMSILSQLTGLSSLELVVGSLDDNESASYAAIVPESDLSRFANLKEKLDVSWSPVAGAARAPTSIYLRDWLLRDIPHAVFEKLQALRIRFYVPYYLLWTTREILPFAKDLRAGAWRDGPDLKPGLSDADCKQHMQRWMEARAAVHWDHGLSGNAAEVYPRPPGYWDTDAAKIVRKQLQWCTWAREWSARAEGGEVLAVPRSYGELFPDDAAADVGRDGMEGDVDDASWAWHKKRKADEMS